MTLEDKVHAFRLRVLQRAQELGNVSAACREAGISRTLFYTLEEARMLIENWRHECNTIRPHSGLGYRAPAPETLALVGAVGGGLN